MIKYMWKYVWCVLFLLFCYVCRVKAQFTYTNLNTTVDTRQFCNQYGVAQVGGTIRANNNVYMQYHFVGMTYRFYYKSGASYIPIGNYTIRNVSGSVQTSYTNINPTYFDGARLYNPMILENTYDPTLPNEGGLLQTSFFMPLGTFPNHAGMQFAFTMEAIDQINVTSWETEYKDFKNPILHPGSITAPAISASHTSVCGGSASFISTTPDLSGQFTFTWYRDFVQLIGETGSGITVTSPGTYKVAISDGCTSATTDEIVIMGGSSPAAPVIVSSTSSPLCDGASTSLSVQGSPAGTVTWSNGATGNSITVSSAGSYSARVTTSCGTSDPSNTIVVTTGARPPAPVIASNLSGPLCNGATAVVYITNPFAAVTWSTGQTGTSINVSSAGSYTAVQTNGCGASPVSNTITFSAGDVAPAPVVVSSNGTTLCTGQSTVLSTTPSAGGVILWSTNTNGNSITVSAPGTYYAYEYNACGYSANSNAITITNISVPSAPTIAPAGPVNVCDGAFTTLSVSGAGSFSWFRDGNYISSAGSISTSTHGTYTVKNANTCGSSAASNAVVVNSITRPAAPTVTPPGNHLLCNGETKSFTASGTNITWSNGSIGNTMTTSVAGTYYAIDQNSCGTSNASNSVVISTGNCPTPSPGTSFFVCPGTLKTLDAGAGYETYSWNNGENTQKISVGPGNYAVTVTKNGCSATSVMVTVGYFTVVTPVINPSGPLTFCNGASVTLTASTGVAYAWSNGATTNPITITTPGSYFVTVTDANGCQATSANTNVVVNPLPTASISGTKAVCQNSASPTILFTGNNATAPYTFFYKINGGSTQTVTTTSGNSVSVAVPTNVFGTFSYELVGVQESSSTTCYNAASGNATVTVNELPGASVSGSTTVCKYSTAPSITFTGTGGVAPYTFTYSINGGSSQSVTTTSGNTVTVSVPTNTPGTYAYSLMSVKESSGTTCSNAAAGIATVTVRDLPNASVSGTTAVCQYTASPSVTFTGSNGVAPYTFSYRINSGAVQSVTTTSGNSVTVSAPTNTPGSFVYTLLSVSESGTATCANTASGSIEVIVNPQPATANIAAPNLHLCNGETGIITVLNWQEGFTYTWYKDGLVFSTTQSQTLSVTQPGSYTVMVTSPEGCNAAALSNTVVITVGSISTPVITGKLKVCEGGKTKLLLSPTKDAWVYEKILWTHLRKEPPLLYDSVFNANRFSAVAGQYRVLVKREGCVDSTLVAVTSNDTEVPAGELTIFPNTIPYGGRTTLTAALNNTERYEWDFGDGRKAVTVSGSLDQAFFTTKDSVVVKLHAVSETNCQTDFTAVLAIGKPDVPKTIDPPFVGNLKDWNFFPVPFRDELKLSVILKRNEKVRLDLFTADGSWIRAYEFSGKKGENLFQMQKLESLSSGVLYLVTGIYNGEKHYEKIYKY